MALELVYTSVPAGLKRGTYGFCTVACTQNIPAIIASTLENLSGYRHLFPAGSPQNPVIYSHLTLSLGGLPAHLLSRIADAGLDYTQRTNKLAHHVVLQDSIDEPPAAGPAALFSKPGMFLTQWNQEPAYIPHEKQIPHFDESPGICRNWGSAAGDPGWGGVLAGSLILKRPVCVIYKPGTDLFPLFRESVALLPHHLRWDATFTTFFTKLPPGTKCLWKGIIAGSTEEAQSRAIPNAIFINLTTPLKAGDIEKWSAADSEVARLIETARTGTAFAGISLNTPAIGQTASKRNAEVDEFDEILGEVVGTRRSGVVPRTSPSFPTSFGSNLPSLDEVENEEGGTHWGLIIGLICAIVFLFMAMLGLVVYKIYKNAYTRPTSDNTPTQEVPGEQPSADDQNSSPEQNEQPGQGGDTDNGERTQGDGAPKSSESKKIDSELRYIQNDIDKEESQKAIEELKASIDKTNDVTDLAESIKNDSSLDNAIAAIESLNDETVTDDKLDELTKTIPVLNSSEPDKPLAYIPNSLKDLKSITENLKDDSLNNLKTCNNELTNVLEELENNSKTITTNIGIIREEIKTKKDEGVLKTICEKLDRIDVDKFEEDGEVIEKYNKCVESLSCSRADERIKELEDCENVLKDFESDLKEFARFLNGLLTARISAEEEKLEKICSEVGDWIKALNDSKLTIGSNATAVNFNFTSKLTTVERIHNLCNYFGWTLCIDFIEGDNVLHTTGSDFTDNKLIFRGLNENPIIDIELELTDSNICVETKDDNTHNGKIVIYIKGDKNERIGKESASLSLDFINGFEFPITCKDNGKPIREKITKKNRNALSAQVVEINDQSDTMVLNTEIGELKFNNYKIPTLPILVFFTVSFSQDKMFVEVKYKANSNDSEEVSINELCKDLARNSDYSSDPSFDEDSYIQGLEKEIEKKTSQIKIYITCDIVRRSNTNEIIVKSKQIKQ